MTKFVDDAHKVYGGIRYQLLSDKATPPKRNSGINHKVASDDVGLDLFVSEVKDIEKDEDGVVISCTVKTDTVLVAPPGHSIILAPRSSLSKSGWFISNTIGIIDNAYRGELLVMLARLPNWGVKRKPIEVHVATPGGGSATVVSMEKHSIREPVIPNKGDRVAQCIVARDIVLPLYESEGDLSSENTGRGKKGFGSSGR